ILLKERTPQQIIPLSLRFLCSEKTTGSAVNQSGTLLPGIIKISNFLSRTWDKIYGGEEGNAHQELRQRNDKPWKIFSLQQGSIQCNHSCTTFLRTSNVQDLGLLSMSSVTRLVSIPKLSGRCVSAVSFIINHRKDFKFPMEAGSLWSCLHMSNLNRRRFSNIPIDSGNSVMFASCMSKLGAEFPNAVGKNKVLKMFQPRDITRYPVKSGVVVKRWQLERFKTTKCSATWQINIIIDK
ncbi:hypothetical protein CR513_39618, partial [Mucuna pruriens]